LIPDDGKKRAKSETREITLKYVDALAKIAKEGEFLQRQSKYFHTHPTKTIGAI
jgi:hypothetical protein